MQVGWRTTQEDRHAVRAPLFGLCPSERVRDVDGTIWIVKSACVPRLAAHGPGKECDSSVGKSETVGMAEQWP